MGKLLKLYQKQKQSIYEPTKSAINLLAFRVANQFLDLSPISVGNLLSSWTIGYKSLRNSINRGSLYNDPNVYDYHYSNWTRYDGSKDINGIMDIAKNDIDVQSIELDNRKLTDTIFITNFATVMNHNNNKSYAYDVIFNSDYGGWHGRNPPRKNAGEQAFKNAWDFETSRINLK